MKKRFVLMGVTACAAMLFLAAGLNASSGECPDVITMKNEKAFDAHRMGIVDFSHKKHAEEYDIGCGDCHHDDQGQPLTDLKCGEPVQSCFECHDKTGRPRVDRSLPPEERAAQELEYYYGAIHANCIDCHKEAKTEAAPVSCTACHPKPEQN